MVLGLGVEYDNGRDVVYGYREEDGRGMVIVIVLYCINRFIVIVVQLVIVWNFEEVGVRTGEQGDWWQKN
jgi:hypothetical protein